MTERRLPPDGVRRVRQELDDLLADARLEDKFELAWGEMDNVIDAIWPVVGRLVTAVDELHACIGVEFRDVDPEVQRQVVSLHRTLHHPEDFEGEM